MTRRHRERLVAVGEQVRVDEIMFRIDTTNLLLTVRLTSLLRWSGALFRARVVPLPALRIAGAVLRSVSAAPGYR